MGQRRYLRPRSQYSRRRLVAIFEWRMEALEPVQELLEQRQCGCSGHNDHNHNDHDHDLVASNDDDRALHPQHDEHYG